MKNIILVLPLILILSSCTDNLVSPDNGWFITPAVNSYLPVEEKNNLREIAGNLAYAEIQRMEYSRQPLEIPSEIVDFYYNVLLHLHNNLQSAVRDDIFYNYRIPEGIPYKTHNITLYSDSVYKWMNNWLENETITGYAPMDSLLVKYKLYLVSYFIYYPSTSFSVLFKSDKYLNVSKMNKIFKSIDEIKYSDADGYTGENHRISAYLSGDNNSVIIKFYLGWGDCPSGCINSHIWEFQVFRNGSVKYIGNSGDPIPTNWYLL